MARAVRWRHAAQGMALRRRLPPEPESLEQRLDREASSDLLDVPAAVICTICGEADCPGCAHTQSRSGIVAIVAWERSAPLLSRLWATARCTTRDAEGFFELLPDGPVSPALGFAAICEVLAASAVVLSLVPVAALVAPDWLAHLAIDPQARGVALRVVFLGIPGLAALLVLAHAAHGLSIDLGARRAGADGARSRALRFGLYACGWDLVIGPLGAIVVAFKEGVSPALSVMSLASGLPTRATQAFLRGCYHLDGARATRALTTSYAGAILATVIGAFAILGAILALALT